MRLFDRVPGDVLLVDAEHGADVTAGQVADLAGEFAGIGPRLAFLFADLSAGSVARFLALLEAGVPVLPLDAAMKPEAALELVRRYEPELVLAPGDDSPVLASLPREGLSGPGVWVSDRQGPEVHADLAVLLSTSGSTGSPKLVRLSRGNVVSNARGIAESLGLRPGDRAVTSLPLFYSFGMSVVTSHIAAGSSVVVSPRSVLEREFWAQVAAHRVTHLAGVPQTYAMLRRLRFSQMDLPHLKALLQAGGRLDPALVAEFHDDAAAKGRRFFVMYGQTEASPRMACLPPGRLPEKLGSAGRALPGGRFGIQDASGEELPAGRRGEIVYCGPNVMMGYAQERCDLARGDESGGVLHTGDLGYLDEEGFLYLTGRTKRIAKISGVRVSLDEVEALLGAVAPVAVVAAPDDGVVVFTTHTDPDLLAKVRRALAADLGAAPKLVDFRVVPELPVMPSGKVDYAALTRMGQASGS